jgi:release factor glutamine methyltransferase
MTTTRALVDEGAERLRSLGMDTPRLDTELLLAHAIGVDRTAVVAHGDAPVGATAEATFRAYLDRRAAGEPVAYIRGIKEFHGIALTVDPRALIPRPETEALVDQGMAEIMARLTSAARAGTVRVIDVGTGSGAIAIALAVALRKRGVPPEDVAITAVDISEDALDLARENAVGHAVGDRLSFAVADLLPPASSSAPWDLVVANLPYVRAEEIAGLPVDVRFEPTLALDGGPDGLAVIGRLLDALPGALAADGVATLEIGADQGASIASLADERLPTWSCRVEVDLAGLPRIAIVRRATAG